MSRESLRVVTKLYDAINRGDMDALAALTTPDVEWVNPSYAVEPGTHTGHDGFSAAVTNLRHSFPTLEYSIDSLEQHGDHVVVTVTFRGRVKDGGEMTWPRHHVWTLRDGKVCRFRWFSEPSHALVAVGRAE